MKFSTRYDEKSWQKVDGFSSDKPSLTSQAWLKATNIAEIVKNGQTGVEVYGVDDYAYDFEAQQNEVVLVKRAYDNLTATQKKKFGSVEAYLAYLMQDEQVQSVQTVEKTQVTEEMQSTEKE